MYLIFKAIFNLICVGIGVTAFVMIARDMLFFEDATEDAEQDAQS